MCVSARGVIHWNGSAEVKLIKNLNQFKRKFKKEVLDFYNREDCVRKAC